LSFGWHLQFLTIIGLSLSTVTFIFGLIADLTSTALSKSPSLNSDPPAVALSEHLFRFKNYLALVAAPIEVTISVLYWTLKAIDGKLLVPPDLPLPPAIYDLGFHLVPAVVLTLDYVLLSPPWPTTPMNESAPMITLALSTVVAFTYWTWIVRIPPLSPIEHPAYHISQLGNLLLPEWLLPLPHLCDTYDKPTNRVVCCKRGDYVGRRWIVESVVCEDKWV